MPPLFGVSQTVRRVGRSEISHNRDVAATSAANRGEHVRRGQRLEYFTVAYNSLEGAASMVAGVLAGSVSLVGFGLDSLIEVASGAALLWRLHYDLDTSRREQVERTAFRTVRACFIALALYILYESSSTLIRHVPPERSIAGIVIASISVIVMPLLARAKRRVARQIGSGAMHADSKQADFCTYLSAILLGGLLLNAFFGWWWMDPRCRTGDGSDHWEGRRVTDSEPRHAAIVASIISVACPRLKVDGFVCLRRGRCDADHWRALRNANTLLSSAPRNSGKRSWTNWIISRR